MSKLVKLKELPPGSEFRTPDWPKCKTWPEDLKGWDGIVVSHGVGSSVITRGYINMNISGNTEVILISKPPP